MIGVGRDLWSSSRAGSPTAGCTGFYSGSFEYPQRKRLHNLSEQPVPMFCHHHSKSVFSSYPDGTSCVSVPVYCPLFWGWTPLKRVWSVNLMPASWTVLYVFETPDHKSGMTLTLWTIQKQREHIVDYGYKKTAATKVYAFLKADCC